MAKKRVSEYFKLGRSQASLDFVDVDIRRDAALFVDPRALRLIPDQWTDECVALVRDFFHHVLQEIKAGRNERARELLAALKEPNEVHLGFSKAHSRGTALGPDSAEDVWQALSESEAVQSGLLEDLEDTILMVENISSDRVSDITINLIRGPLIRYTQAQAQLHGIPLEDGVDSGPLWDPDAHDWYQEFVQLPVTPAGRLLLVPKAIVRSEMSYSHGEYFRHFVLTHLQGVERTANSGLVQLLKNGKTRVTKKSLVEKYGKGKKVTVDITRDYPEILQRYRASKSRQRNLLLSHSQLAAQARSVPPDWDALLAAVTGVGPGRDGASAYEKAIEALLTALLYPGLTFPDPQFPLHEGRKRVDIKFTNSAQTGFFRWVGQHYPCAHVFVECKNYTREIANPELDQLAGRFSPSRGMVGLLVGRRFDDKPAFLRRCRDTALDQRGFIIALDDDDLAVLVAEVRGLGDTEIPDHALLRQRFDGLIA